MPQRCTVRSIIKAVVTPQQPAGHLANVLSTIGEYTESVTVSGPAIYTTRPIGKHILSSVAPLAHSARPAGKTLLSPQEAICGCFPVPLVLVAMGNLRPQISLHPL